MASIKAQRGETFHALPALLHARASRVAGVRRIAGLAFAAVDVLADLLARARARGAVFAQATLHAPWGIAMADDAPLSFHAVLRGEAWLRPPDGGAPVHLLQGDVALVRHPGVYALASAPDAPTVPLATILERWREGERRYLVPGTGARTALLCGAYRLDGGLCDGLLAALPPVVHLPAGTGADAGSLRVALGLLGEEVDRAAPGQQTVLDRLLDLLLVYALRSHFSRPQAASPPWYRALEDPEVGRALRLLHEQPGRAWTIAGLASEVGLSRAALARRFTGLVGVPPLQYLTGWRMALATEQLRDSGRTLAAIAREVGYSSEYAFSAAFKRERGVAPAGFRRELRAAA